MPDIRRTRRSTDISLYSRYTALILRLLASFGCMPHVQAQAIFSEPDDRPRDHRSPRDKCDTARQPNRHLVNPTTTTAPLMSGAVRMPELASPRSPGRPRKRQTLTSRRLPEHAKDGHSQETQTPRRDGLARRRKRACVSHSGSLRCRARVAE